MFTKEIQLYSSMLNKRFNTNVSTYPDGTPLVNFPNFAVTGEISGSQINYGPDVVDTIIIRPKTFESFITGLFLVDALEARGVKIGTLVLPFIPGARQDRINPAGDFLFTLKSVAKMINDRNFDKVVVLDPHSNVATGLIDRVQVYPIEHVLENFKLKYDGLIAPDAGAGQRTREAADALAARAGHGYEVVQAFKHRDVETGKLSSFEVNVESGKHYLVFDDICDGGGTFVGLGQKIKAQGATADLFVTHGVFSKGTDKLAPLFRSIVTTDSTLFAETTNGIQVIPVTDRMI